MNKITLGIAADKPGAGKDTVADILIKNHGFEKQSFGALVKEEIALFQRLGIPPEAMPHHLWLWWNAKKCHPYSTYAKPTDEIERELMQWWGTDWRREENPDYWVEMLFKFGASQLPELLVINDVRFENEFDRIRKIGGRIIAVTCPYSRYGYTERITTHPSEGLIERMGSEQFDFHINNSGTIEDLEAQVADMMKALNYGPALRP